ncbi:Hpr(Ser) kinase/phosphatase [Parasphingorhabdus marina DSM 22363]|uniref:Hpr(Ser) kinase/phosphatase n=1 Tax=Parasphingorhabdus marina DSM 22363 TaxID=1123272 RepID=A0A1N6F987_9SPHN|nr:HPr kinase/phosphatase C-terminal domain-containing protein [Parasphingorhabdus marina]SIN91776.1 Hpr(Ser) kinase/phosphatase [Parasphingorhabdus marina DSM 22363]
MSSGQPEIVHATAIAMKDQGVLLLGPSGAGKSDLALRLIDRGARLISDDQTELLRSQNRVLLRPAPNIAGKLEVRSLGIISMEHVSDVPLRLQVRLVEQPDRYPMDRQFETVQGVDIPTVAINAFEHSAPLKVEIALQQLLAQEHKS